MNYLLRTNNGEGKKLMNSEILSVLLVLSINLVATFTYLFFLADENRKKAFFCLPAFLQKAFVAFFVGPLFISPFMPQSRFPGLPEAINITLSLLLVIIGVVFILGAFFKIGSVPSLKAKSNLVTQGVYGIVRHPIYAGTILTFLGLILFKNALGSLFYFPVSIGLYFLMTIFEERSLINEYGQEYLDYQRNVRKRIIPFVI
jgi:protein-S-isoprenylcysteine O-methyltransferase Ste14